MTHIESESTRRPRTIRTAVVAGIAAVLVIGAGALVLAGQEDDEEYTADDLASWCSVARNRDFPVMLASGFASPFGEDVEVAGSTIPAGEAREMGNALLRSILRDPPPEIAEDVEASIGPLLAAYEDGSAPGMADQERAIAAAARSQTYIDEHC